MSDDQMENRLGANPSAALLERQPFDDLANDRIADLVYEPREDVKDTTYYDTLGVKPSAKPVAGRQCRHLPAVHK